MGAGEGKVGSGGSRQSYENEWVPNHADNAGFQPFFCLTIGTRTPAEGRGWFSAAPLALFDRPLLFASRTHIGSFPGGVVAHAIALVVPAIRLIRF